MATLHRHGGARWSVRLGTAPGPTVLAAHLAQWRTRGAPEDPSTTLAALMSPIDTAPPGAEGVGMVQLVHRRGSLVEIWGVRASPELPDAVVGWAGAENPLRSPDNLATIGASMAKSPIASTSSLSRQREAVVAHR